MASSSHVFSKSNGLQPNSGIYFLLNVCIIPIKKDHSSFIDTIYDRPLWCQMIHVADPIWRDKAWLLLLCNPLPHLSSCGSPWIDIVNRWVYLEKDEQLRSICKMVTNSIDVIFFFGSKLWCRRHHCFWHSIGLMMTVLHVGGGVMSKEREASEGQEKKEEPF